MKVESSPMWGLIKELWPPISLDYQATVYINVA